MLCRPRQQQAKDPLPLYPDRSIPGNESLKTTASLFVSFELARLLVDCSTSLAFDRVFIPWNNPRLVDAHGALSGQFRAVPALLHNARRTY